MTDEEIHNIYLHMSGKAEGLFEATGTADFPVLFARAILEYEGMTKDVQNIASKSTYKEQLETKDEPVAWMNRHGACKTSLFMEVEAGAKEEYTIPVYTQPQRTWVWLTDEEMRELEKQFEAERVRTSDEEYLVIYPAAYWQWQRAIEAKLKEKNT